MPGKPPGIDELPLDDGAAGDRGGLRRFILRLEAVAGFAMRQALWGEMLLRLGPTAAAGLLDQVVRHAACGDEGARVAYLPLIHRSGLVERTGPGLLGAMLVAAQEGELDGAQLYLAAPGSGGADADLGPPPDPYLETLSVGQRKTVARGMRSALLERVLKDPDPRVVCEVLRNPRLLESEVVAIASRRPCPGPVFRHLVASERWLLRPAVRRAIVQNPYAEPDLAVSLLPLLGATELRDLQTQARLHPALREGASLVLDWRGGN